MKKNIQFNKKALSLNKETVAKLNEEQLKSIAGGKYETRNDAETRELSCWYNSCNTRVTTITTA